MKNDTISRQEAIDAVLDRMNVEKYGRNAKPEEIQWALEELPPAQPERMTNGHWIFRPLPDDWIGSLYICSECGDVCDSRYRFCPSCGAKMYGFEEE